MSAIRSDKKLARLPAAQQDQLIAWLLDERLSYRQAQERLLQECRVKVSHMTVYKFYLEVCLPLRLRRAAQAANRLPERAGVVMGTWDASSVALVKQRYFELLAAPAADPKELALFATQVVHADRMRSDREKMKLQRQQTATALWLKRRALALSKWKFQTRAADLALRFAREIKTIAANRALDADAKIEQVRQRLFGSAPANPKEDKR